MSEQVITLSQSGGPDQPDDYKSAEVSGLTPDSSTGRELGPCEYYTRDPVLGEQSEICTALQISIQTRSCCTLPSYCMCFICSDLSLMSILTLSGLVE